MLRGFSFLDFTGIFFFFPFFLGYSNLLSKHLILETEQEYASWLHTFLLSLASLCSFRTLVSSGDAFPDLCFPLSSVR